ncbi:hypothetical protein [Coleofasciculus sp.]|uniref:hypothetical protein n=1 Tax=Coleofasciculus sp. TaxID=3100458 RepID=UPI0039FA3AC6
MPYAGLHPILYDQKAMPQKGDRTQSIHTYPMRTFNASSALAVAPQFAAIRAVLQP